MSIIDGWLEIFSLAWVVPLVLDSMMTVATAMYDFFVGGGIIYMLIWGWLAFSIGLYLVKMYFPKEWSELFAFKDGGQMYDEKAQADGWSVSKAVAKPMLRALFAITILLQAKPDHITYYVIDPFLEFGAVYASAITKTVVKNQTTANVKCPKNLGAYMSQEGCLFLVRPIHQVSAVNNRVIKEGLKFILRGFTFNIIDGFMNVVTGLLLVIAFFSSNLFMALLIIQGIIKFGMALIAYPFRVFVYVIKTPDKDDDYLWVNPWPAFSSLVKALQKLVIAVIAVAFIIIVNFAVADALTGFDVNSVNSPGRHSIGWLAAIMTFWFMFEVFNETRRRLDKYVDDKDMTGFYDKVAADTKALAKNVYQFARIQSKIVVKGKSGEESKGAKSDKSGAKPAAPAAPAAKKEAGKK